MENKRWVRSVPTKELSKWDTAMWTNEGRSIVARELKRRRAKQDKRLKKIVDAI